MRSRFRFFQQILKWMRRAYVSMSEASMYTLFFFSLTPRAFLDYLTGRSGPICLPDFVLILCRLELVESSRVPEDLLLPKMAIL